eukprot:scaffold286698_cov15-Tisochrysis_lutea.AAC.1
MHPCSKIAKICTQSGLPKSVHSKQGPACHLCACPNAGIQQGILGGPMDCKCSTLTGYSGVTNLLPPERLSATGPPPPLAACTTCADNTLCCAEGVRPAMRPRPPCKGQGTDDQGAVPPFVLGAGGSDTWS